MTHHHAQPHARRRLTAAMSCAAACLLAAITATAPQNTHADPPPPLADEDPGKHLIRGCVYEVDIAAEQANNFTFVADGPGILTVFYNQPGTYINRNLYDRDNASVLMRNGLKRLDPEKIPHIYGIAVIEKPGDYRLELLPKKHATLVTGAAWLPFPELNQVQERDKNNGKWVVPDLPHHNGEDSWLNALPAMPIGTIATGTSPSGRPRSYHFHANGPGLLTVAARTRTGRDIAIQVRNDKGNKILDGASDRDFRGNQGAEEDGYMIPTAGHYEVVIIPMEGGAEFWFGGTWIALDYFQPDRPNPSSATNKPDAPKPAP